jgi:fatty acid desaturase
MPYHAEHHAFPNVPFHKLPDLHRHTAPHLKSTSDGYAAFNADFTRSLER